MKTSVLLGNPAAWVDWNATAVPGKNCEVVVPAITISPAGLTATAMAFSPLPPKYVPYVGTGVPAYATQQQTNPAAIAGKSRRPNPDRSFPMNPPTATRSRYTPLCAEHGHD